MWGSTFPEGRWREFQIPHPVEVALVSEPILGTSSPCTPSLSPAHPLYVTCAAHDLGRSSGLPRAHGAISHVTSGLGQLVPQEQLPPVLGALTVRVRDDMINHGFNAEYLPVHKQNWGCGDSSWPTLYRLLPKERTVLISGTLEGHSESWTKEMVKNKDNTYN